MMRSFRLFTLITLLPFGILAQQKMLTVEDAVMKQRTSLGPAKLQQLSWIPGSSSFTWIAKVNGNECIVKEDAASQKRDTVLKFEQFRETLSSANPDVPKADRFPAFTWIDENSFRLYHEHAYYLYNLQTNIIKVLVKLPAIAEDMDYEPINNRVAYTQHGNLIVADKSSLTANVSDEERSKFAEQSVVGRGGYGLVNGKAVHRNEFGIEKGTFWSPNGNKLAFYKMNESMVTDYSVLNLETKPATGKNIKYPMAGGASHQVRVAVQDYSKNRQYEVQIGPSVEQYLTNMCWSPDEEYLYIAVVNRDQNEMKLNMYDGVSGTFIKTLFTETNPKYVEPLEPMIFVKNKPNLFLWFSRRDGFNQLYLYDKKGNMLKQLTKGKADVTEFLGFDKTGNTAFYMAADENGLDRYCYAVDITSGKVTTITRNPGVHAVLLSEDGAYLLDSYSNTTTPRRITLMDRTGGELSILVQAANPLMEYQACGLRLFSILSTDKTTKLNCRMFCPPQFDSTKKYPVIVYVYGGPHAQMITNSWLGGADMWLYYMAQQGYVIFTLDNRGSSYRGADFEQAVFRKFGSVEREDQLAGATFLKNQRYIDSTRMGVFGWSFGGFMSVNMMTRTNVFKAGVAGGPVIDWGMYEIMYTERYMDKPQDNPEGYKEANMLNYVKNLKGKLLLIHGTADDVVLWQHSLSYLKKSIDEGVQLDYFVYPGHKHNVIGKDRVHLMQKVTDYFKQNL